MFNNGTSRKKFWRPNRLQTEQSLPAQQILPFKTWVESKPSILEGIAELKKLAEKAPLPSKDMNESKVWKDWWRYAQQYGQTTGPLSAAFESVGFVFRQGSYGLPDKPLEYWTNRLQTEPPLPSQQILPFKTWAESNPSILEGIAELKKRAEAAPLPNKVMNESEVWKNWGRYALQCGQTTGPLSNAFESVGFVVRQGSYGLPNMPDGYWPASVALHNFSGELVSKEATASKTIFAVKLANCKDEDGEDFDGLNAMHMLPSKIVESVDEGKIVYGEYRINQDGGFIIASLTLEPPSISTANEKMVRSGSESELRFLDRLKRYVQQAGFEYPDRDLIRFHTGVKIGLISVLAGEPGTGKSSLVRLYAKALAGSAGGHGGMAGYLRVFVNPTWSQPADFIGEMDPLRGADKEFKFKSAGNGVYECLVAAYKSITKDKSKPKESTSETGIQSSVAAEVGGVGVPIFSICLEEMNLAPVEYYFSDFIQIIDDRDYPIPNVAAEKDVDPLEKPLKLGMNVCLFGTCNNDSSTHPLSPRFLDRCNYVILYPRPIRDSLSLVARASAEKIKPDEADAPISYDAFRQWLKLADAGFEEWDDASSSLDADYGRIRKSLVALGVSPSNRVEEHIKLYVLNRPGEGSSVKAFQLLALDEAIVQMVLPKLRLNSRTMPALEDAKEEFKEVFGEDSLSLAFLLYKEREFDMSDM